MTPSTDGRLDAVLDTLSAGSEYAQGVLDVLALLGLVDLKDGRAAPADAVAAMMVSSLRAHLADSVSVGLSWGDLDGGGLRGVDILRAIEASRVARVSQPSPARIVQAAQAVIKSRREQGSVSQDIYLMQYDLHAGRYQSIGGKRDPDDGDMMDTLRREIGEELGLGHPPGPDECTLALLGDGWVEQALSATYGVFTQYTFTFYQVIDIRFPIAIDDVTRWLTRAEILAGHAADGRLITPIYQQALGWEMLDALEPVVGGWGWGIDD